MRTGSIKKSQGEAYKIFKENISMRDAKKNGKIALLNGLTEVVVGVHILSWGRL